MKWCNCISRFACFCSKTGDGVKAVFSAYISMQVNCKECCLIISAMLSMLDKATCTLLLSLGDFRIMIGASSRDMRLQTLTVKE